MGVDYKVRQIYNETIHEVTKSPENWREVLRLMGRIYRYEFENILMVYAQKPSSSLVADFDTWKKVGRYVNRGSRGIAIYPSRVLSPHCRYVFDISDTGGRNVKLTWSKVDGATKYAVYQYIDGKYKSVASKVTATSYTVKGLDSKKTYKFRVRAYVDGKWVNSDAVSAKTK